MAKHALQYIFFYDPVQTEWTQGYQFEASFAKYLTSIGLEAEIVLTEGNVGARILLIKKKQEVAMPAMPSGSVAILQSKGRPKSIKGQIESLKVGKETTTERDFKKGKLLKRKGYLKK